MDKPSPPQFTETKKPLTPQKYSVRLGELKSFEGIAEAEAPLGLADPMKLGIWAVEIDGKKKKDPELERFERLNAILMAILIGLLVGLIVKYWF